MQKNPPRFAFSVSDRDDSPEAKEIHERLKAHVESEVGAANRQVFTLIIKDASGKLLGGARGFSHWKWLYISHLWVDESARSAGLGAQIIEKTEIEAKNRGCVGIYVDTFSSEARDFYVRQGFQDFGRLNEMPLNGVRYYLEKRV